MATYKTVITNQGNNKIADAIANNTTVNISEVAVGDGNGSFVNPNPAMTHLVHEVYRTQVNNRFVSGNQLTFEAIIPADIGGFTIREVGLFDTNNTLIAIANTVDIEKVSLGDGLGEDTVIRLILRIDAPDVLTITTDPSASYVTMDTLEDILNDIDFIDGGYI